MAGKTLKIDMRRAKILELLERDRQVSVAQLSEALGATTVTIRTDLAALERENRLCRVRGGASVAESEAGFGSQSREKAAIGCAIAERVRDGERLFINSGTTSRAVAGELRRFRELAVVTNSPPVAAMLCDHFHVVLLGGSVSAGGDFTSGEDTLNQLARYQTDWAIVSVDSISAAEGVSICHPEESAVSRSMLERAARGVIVADHTKVGHTGFVRMCAAAAPLMLATDRGADAAELEALRSAGVEVLLA